MVAQLLIGPEETEAFGELLRPEPLPDGTEPEERIILCGLSWERYLALDKALGDDRPGPRFYYLDGELEIMTTSSEHERIKKWIGDFLADYLMHIAPEVMPRGQATMRLALKQAGAEPDESWCIGPEKEFPDLVLEIALTSGGVNKLEVYRRFAVPEVWFWRRNKLEVYVLSAADQYEPSPKSRLLPDLDLSLLERCVAIPSWRQARQTFRAGLSKPESD
jgi:Uma2 family endonuclease